jgi:hypothetical protein
MMDHCWIAARSSIADFDLTRLRDHQYAKESKANLVDQQPVARTSMQKPPLDPDVSDTAPSESVLTVYDEEQLVTRRECRRC